MQIALEEARQAALRGEVPVGACLVLEGQIIARAGNQMRARNNPMAHAEMIVIEQGLKLNQSARLDRCYLYVSLEPCTMCAGAIALVHIRRLYYAAQDKKMGNIAFFASPLCQHRPEIYGGIAEAEAQALIQKFFHDLREK